MAKTDFIFFPKGVQFDTVLYCFEKIKYRRFYLTFEDENGFYTTKQINNATALEKNFVYISEQKYLQCRDIYMRIREAKKQLLMIKVIIEHYNHDLNGALQERRLTTEQYNECLRLSKLNLADEYSKIINS